jgi:hypothetical protein
VNLNHDEVELVKYIVGMFFITLVIWIFFGCPAPWRRG